MLLNSRKCPAQKAGVLVLLSVFILSLACDDQSQNSTLKQLDLSQTSEASLGFDVNDVAFLFPKQNGFNEASPDIKATDLASDGKSLLSGKILEQILAFSHERLPDRLRATEKDLQNWRVQSFRFDPCAPKDASSHALTLNEMTSGQKNADCQIEIRLVLQPMEPKGQFAASGRTADISMHMTYGLASGSDSPELARLVKELDRLKNVSAQIAGGSTAGIPLGRHPGLEAEMNQAATARPLASAVKEFILKNLREDQLVRITFSQVDSLTGTSWLFFGGSVAQDDTGALWIPFDLPHDPGLQSILYRPDNALIGKAIVPVPETLSTNDLFTPASVGRGVVLNPGFGVGAGGRTMPIEEAQKTIQTIEDPTQTNIFTTDCVSCHTSTSRAITLGIPAPALPDRPSGITGYAYAPLPSPTEIQQRIRLHGPQRSTWNVINFGFFESQATVSNRTVNEAMHSALYVNALFFGGQNPGLDCVEADREGAVATCVLEGKRDNCLALCIK